MKRACNTLKKWFDKHYPKIPPLTTAALATMALIAAGCGSSNSNGDAAKAFKSAIDPTGIRGLNISCAHDQGTRFTCKVSGVPTDFSTADGPGIYAVTYDPKSKYIYFQKVGQ